MNANVEANPETRRPPRLLELDGIRGLAITLVLFEHFVGRSITGSGWLADALEKLRFFGASGVDLFFVLSGFLIGGILMDNRAAENYFKAFYIRRGCRILPVYLLVLAVYLALKVLLAAYSSEDWFKELFLQGGMPFWAYLTFAQNIVKAATFLVNSDFLIVTWSLVVEEQFYLVLHSGALAFPAGKSGGHGGGPGLSQPDAAIVSSHHQSRGI